MLIVVCTGLLRPPAPAVRAQTPAPEIQVFVAYADNARAKPEQFPTPWDGSPNVIFKGCQSACKFDGGAVMVLNNSDATVTVNSVEIGIDTCRINLWPSDIALAGKQNLILTQTATGGEPGCEGQASGNLDTSDIGPGGADYGGNCTPNGIKPVVKVTIGGVASELRDEGQVLNTGGFDKGDCPPGTNESSQWTLVGGVACPGAVVSLDPGPDTEDGDDTPTVLARVINECGTGLPNVKVDFLLVSGADAAGGGSANSDSTGTAKFTYHSAAAGTVVLRASVTNPAGTIQSKELTLRVGEPGSGTSPLPWLLLAAAMVLVVALGGGLWFRRRRLATATAVALPAGPGRSRAPVIYGAPPMPQAVAADAWLELKSADGERYPLGEDPVTVGFTADCSVSLPAGGAARPERVRIWRREGTYMLHNLSRFGSVSVEGRPAVTWIVLEDGDEIVVGDQRLIFHFSAPDELPPDREAGSS